MFRFGSRLAVSVKRGLHHANFATGNRSTTISTAAAIAAAIVSFAAVDRVVVSEEESDKYFVCHAEGKSTGNNNKVSNYRQPNIEPLVADLRKHLRSDQIELDPRERQSRGKPWSSFHKIEEFPQVIVYPESTQNVSDIMKLCYKHNVPVVPFGGGTSLEGQILASRGGLSLDFNHMKRIVELNEKDMDLTVQAGMGYVELNELLKDKGLWFPLDPGPGASIGGMCSCRCSGSTAVRYGSMRENVLNLTAVLPDGTVIKTGSRARKSSAGYDLTRLLIGSEGTLAVVTEATLKLHPIPHFAYALRMTFPSVEQAAAAAHATMISGVTVGRLEMLDDTMVKIVNAMSPTAEPWPEQTTLMFEIAASSEVSVQEQLNTVVDIGKKHGGYAGLLATNKDETKALWLVRKQCIWSAMSMYPDREPMITDACVPLSKLPDIIRWTREKIDATNLPSPIIAHAGDGNFHVVIMLRPNVADDVATANELAAAIAMKAISLGGTCTGEHGIGVGKKKYLLAEMGPGSINLMKKIKATIDDRDIMNPGKVLDK